VTTKRRSDFYHNEFLGYDLSYRDLMSKIVNYVIDSEKKFTVIHLTYFFCYNFLNFELNLNSIFNKIFFYLIIFHRFLHNN